VGALAGPPGLAVGLVLGAIVGCHRRRRRRRHSAFTHGEPGRCASGVAQLTPDAPDRPSAAGESGAERRDVA
jgi:hypothetical protein